MRRDAAEMKREQQRGGEREIGAERSRNRAARERDESRSRAARERGIMRERGRAAGQRGREIGRERSRNRAARERDQAREMSEAGQRELRARRETERTSLRVLRETGG
ncbi:hypothetical protein AAC387_Pa03g0854 [Persea americana]